jgi:hypothetical protein
MVDQFTPLFMKSMAHYSLLLGNIEIFTVFAMGGTIICYF